MNDKISKYTLLLLLPALLLFSCAQEDMPAVAERTQEPGIFFRTALPVVGTRSSVTTVVGNLNAGFHVSAICPENDVEGTLNPHFTDQLATPLEGMPGYFGMFDQSSELHVWPTIRHGKQGKLRFFAFYPSREAMMQSAGVESGYFGLTNKTTKSGGTVAYDYRMENFKINRDITRHIDFVTATAEGSRRDNGESGVRLDFEHQLSRVLLKAWGNTDNDIEIAGVRIGSVITESAFNFAAKPAHYAQGDNTASGNWVAPQVRGCVEYIFREGDAVVKVGNGSHTTVPTAASIMGNVGWAMVIPADYTGWNHTKDAPNNSKGLYLSVLLRVKENDENRTLVYPYIGDSHLSASVMTDDMEVIFLAIEKSTGKVMKRLYRKAAGEYFTDPAFTTAYSLPATEDIRNYGWAAVPLTTVRWKPGYQYSYTLNYSGGVGVHDPLDPYPGRPIVSKILVSVTENGQTWPMVYDFTEGEEVDATNNITIE